MKAMVLAAGVGSRLRPLTDRLPKPLVPIGGRPLIETVLRRLAAVGVTDIVVNVYHHADQMERYLRSATHLGLRIEISREIELLDTGGGLKKVAPFFAGTEPFFVHNADVVSDVDLRRLYATHCQTGALATLSVRARPASRLLLFDADARLCGWEDPRTGEQKWAAGPVATVTRVGFDGIQVLAPGILEALVETGAFSLIQTYLRLAGQGERILACHADGNYWSDVGTLAKIEAVEQHVAAHGLPD